MKRVSGERGFTLLELIVALALLSLISAFLFGALGFGRRAWERSADLQDVATVGAVQGFVRQTLSRARPTFGRTDGNDRAVLFSGTRDRVRFVANAYGRTTLSGLHVFEISGAPETETPGSKTGLALLVRQALYRPIAEDPLSALSEGTPRHMLDGLAGVSFRYFGAPDPGAAPAWHPQWRSTRTLPTLISMTVSFPANDPRRWADLIVELKLAADPG